MSEKRRLLSTWATVLLRAANVAAPTDRIKRQASELRAEILCRNTWKLANKQAMETLELTAKLDLNWQQNEECLGYVVKFTTRNAQNKENHVVYARKKEWSKFAAGSGSGCAKGGYKYAKGFTGSRNSPIVDQSHDDDDEEEEHCPTSEENVRLPDDVHTHRGISIAPITYDKGA